MSIAITADLHLTSRAEHPQRFAALVDILDQMVLTSVGTLIIAGDLFDANRRSYHEFEELVGRPEYRSLHIVAIPGNHDIALKQNSFTLPNLVIIDQPRLVRLEEKGLPFLFLPYKPGLSAGDQMVGFRESISPQEFVLISHGDYISGVRAPNPLERGIYFPLTRQDIEKYQPARLFLGHTHLSYEQEKVVSPGSPAAIDPTETGRRGFLIYDSVANTLERRFLRQGPIYMREKFLVLPSDLTGDNLQEEIQLRVKSWGFSDAELKRVELQAVFSGCSPDKTAIREKILQTVNGITLYPGGEPDVSNVISDEDPALAAAVALALQKAGDLILANSPANPDLEEIQRSVFRLIYET
jgi:DNA repair protein SbcD/Mre11